MQFTSIEALRKDLDKVVAERARLDTIESALRRALGVLESDLSLDPTRAGSGGAIGSITKPEVTPAELKELGDKIEPKVTPEVPQATHFIPEPAPEVTPALKADGTPRRKPGGVKRMSLERVRDAAIELQGEWTLRELGDKLDFSTSGLKPYIDKLLKQGVLTTRKQTGQPGNPPWLYKYNTEFPKGPTERPKVTPPEKELIGASVTRGAPVAQSNGNLVTRSRYPQIQSIIDAIISQGGTVEHKDNQRGQGGRHLKATLANGNCVGFTDTDERRVPDLIKRDLRRSGLRI